ncbi:MAG: efflux RND transporter periplasmic adaptor subunit [Pyrinomonadaceae bacterium]|nr:efflux RND transporter periplasmic adaptor subunit [Phycisphaerales bacterium]
MNRRGWIGSVVLLGLVAGAGFGLASWKAAASARSAAVAANQPEPMEVVSVALATQREHRQTTTAIGTVRALRSITLRIEVPGTVREVMLTPGQVVAAGTLLVALDTSVEEAELKAQEAQAELSGTLLRRTESAHENNAVSEIEVDRARAERNIAEAQIARINAIIARKRIVAPFPAKLGMSDVHPGQYLDEGVELTTLQGVDDAAHVDFSVAQTAAAGLHEGDVVEVFAAGRGNSPPIKAPIISIDARIDPATRSAMVRAKIERGPDGAPAPGASVRVRVPVGPPRNVVVVPVNALRKGPAGDHVFVIEPDKEGKPRAHIRPVQSGTMLGNEVVIHTGISAGEQVASSGSFKLREGALVSIAGGAPKVASTDR